jgi:ribonuclease Z
MELTFFGTASSCPSKYRNVTALYLDFFDKGGLLLDVGEDTLGQMKRRWVGVGGG